MATPPTPGGDPAKPRPQQAPPGGGASPAPAGGRPAPPPAQQPGPDLHAPRLRPPVNPQAGPTQDPAPPGSPAGRGRASQLADAERTLAGAASAEQQELGRRAVNELFGFPDVEPSTAGDTTVTVSVYPGHDGATVRAHRVPVETIERPYVPASGYGALSAAVVDPQRRLVVVRGRSGSGKAAALLHALTGGVGDVTVMRLDTRTDLATLAPAQLPDCQVIVLDDLTAQHLDALDENTVDRLSAELLGANRWLGLTVTDDLPINSAVEAVVVDIGDPPTPRQVFDRLLEYGLDPAPRERLLADPAVAQLLDEQLTPATALRRAARLAQRLSRPGHEPAVLVAAVRTQIDDRDRDECVQWFRTLPGLRAHCMALALAVLNGQPREEVTAAADRLVELIAPRPDRPEPGPAVDPFGQDAGVPLATLRAVATPATRTRAEGEIRITELRYRDALFPSWVLRHAWDEHDSARAHVVTWLRELGGHPNQDVRMRVAAAVGVLATGAFEFVYAQIISSWARDDDETLRDSAALALGPPCRDEQLRHTVGTLVQGWLGTADEPLLQATAARTFGGDAGLARPSHALRQLALLAEVDDIAVAVAVARSLGELVVQGTAALAGRVLADITGWVDQRRTRLQLVGRLAFLRLTYLRGAPTPAGGKPDPAVRSVPTLLVLALGDRRILGRLTWLWVDGLNSSDAHAWMQTSLTGWAASVEQDPRAQAVFLDLVAAAAADRRTARNLVRAAEGWRSDPGTRSVADAVLAQLTGVVPHG